MHNIGGQGSVLELFLAVEEWVAVETDVCVVDALLAERVSDPLASHRRGHERHNVPDASGELEHNHDQRDRHPGDTSEAGRRPYDGVQARCYASVPGRALLGEQGIVKRELFHSYADYSAHYRAHAQRWYEKTAGYLHTEGEDGHDELEDEGHHQEVHRVYVGEVLLEVTEREKVP